MVPQIHLRSNGASSRLTKKNDGRCGVAFCVDVTGCVMCHYMECVAMQGAMFYVFFFSMCKNHGMCSGTWNVMCFMCF